MCVSQCVCVCLSACVCVLHGIFGMLYILSRSLCREQECDGIWTVMLVFEGFKITLAYALSVYFMGISLAVVTSFDLNGAFYW